MGVKYLGARKGYYKSVKFLSPPNLYEKSKNSQVLIIFVLYLFVKPSWEPTVCQIQNLIK